MKIRKQKEKKVDELKKFVCFQFLKGVKKTWHLKNSKKFKMFSTLFVD